MVRGVRRMARGVRRVARGVGRLFCLFQERTEELEGRVSLFSSASSGRVFHLFRKSCLEE